MTDQEIIDLACSGVRPLSVSMSRADITFTVGTDVHDITEDQAELLWRILPIAGRHQSAALPIPAPHHPSDEPATPRTQEI